MYLTDPLSNDTDTDGMPDGWEVGYAFNPLSGADASLDPDGDGLTNLDEFALGTNPQSNDTDRDGIPDGWEVNNGFDLRDPNVPLNESLLYNAPLIGVLVVVIVSVTAVVVVLSILVVRRRSGRGV